MNIGDQHARGRADIEGNMDENGHRQKSPTFLRSTTAVRASNYFFHVVWFSRATCVQILHVVRGKGSCDHRIPRHGVAVFAAILFKARRCREKLKHHNRCERPRNRMPDVPRRRDALPGTTRVHTAGKRVLLYPRMCSHVGLTTSSVLVLRNISRHQQHNLDTVARPENANFLNMTTHTWSDNGHK